MLALGASALVHAGLVVLVASVEPPALLQPPELVLEIEVDLVAPATPEPEPPPLPSRPDLQQAPVPASADASRARRVARTR